MRYIQNFARSYMVSRAPMYPPAILPADITSPCGQRILPWPGKHRDRHQRGSDPQQRLQRIRMHQIVMKHQYQHQQQIGGPIQNNEAKPETDERARRPCPLW